jgi:peptidoglycan/LPS O-acetylase OafA/YrhL
LKVQFSEQGMAKPRSYIYGIDVIRFLAALSVVGFHLGYLNNAADFRFIWPVTWFGWIGVEVFFVLSGFVIANSANGASPMQFLKGRALRLYPAAWCCAIFTLFVRSAVSGEPLADVLPSYLRSIALVPKGPWIDDVYWTLAIEIGFYALIFGLLCAGVFSLLSRVSLALTTFSSLCLCILAARHWHLLELTRVGELVERSNVLLARHGCFFALGAWIWISTTRQLRIWEYTGVAIAVAACLGEICLHGLEFLPREIGNDSWLIAPVLVWFAAVGCIVAFSRPGTVTVVSGKTAEFIRTLGLMTYPLYLVHHVVGIAVQRGIILMGFDKWFALTFSILSTAALSWIVCEYCEPWVRNALKGITIRQPVKSVAIRQPVLQS